MWNEALLSFQFERWTRWLGFIVFKENQHALQETWMVFCCAEKGDSENRDDENWWRECRETNRSNKALITAQDGSIRQNTISRTARWQYLPSRCPYGYHKQKRINRSDTEKTNGQFTETPCFASTCSSQFRIKRCGVEPAFIVIVKMVNFKSIGLS